MTKQSFSIVIIYILSILLPVFLTAILQELISFDELLLFIYINLFSLLIAIFYILRMIGISLDTIKTLFYDLKPVFIWSIIGIVSAIFIQSSMVQVENYLFNNDKHETNNFDTIELIKMNWIALISPVILAPILEEVIFRRVIFKSIYFKTNFIIASICSSIIFALVHFDLTHTGTYILIGMLLCYLYIKSDRLIVPILVHMALNSLPILLALILY